MASVIHVPTPKRDRQRRSPSPAMPRPMKDDGSGGIRIDHGVTPSPVKRDRHRLLGGAQEEVPNGDGKHFEGRKMSRKGSDMGSFKSEKRDRVHTPVDDEGPKMRAALKTYEATVAKLVHKLKSEKAMYLKSIDDLELTNKNLSEEVGAIRDVIFQLTSQRAVEKDLVEKLREDYSSLMAKNGQLEGDLVEMVQNIQKSENAVEEMRRRALERDNEILGLAADKKYLMLQVDEMKRMSSSFSEIDGFAPPEGRKDSRATNCDGECNRDGVMGMLFGRGRGSRNRMFVFGCLLGLGFCYVFQNIRLTQAVPVRCHYDTEMLAQM